VREDILLRTLVTDLGENNWAGVAAEMRNRNPRQCRERWFNYLSPNIRNLPWTELEDAILLNKVKEHGPAWHRIAPCFPRRTDINIKNRYHVLTRKRQDKGDPSIPSEEPLPGSAGQTVAASEPAGAANVVPPSGASPFSLSSLLNG
jgi:hypothetical protein